MSLMPVVQKLRLGLGPLATAVHTAALPEHWIAPAPVEASEWRARIEDCRQPTLGFDWVSTLREAMQPSGAAAARLARVRDGQGVVVTTGQQPGLFGGPMYTIGKALSALALANRLEATTGVPAAPIFWAATDDADFAEGAVTWLPVPGGVRDVRLHDAPADGTMMSHAPLGDMRGALDVLLQSAAGAAWPEVIRAALAAYRAPNTVGSAYVALMRHLLMPLGITVLDAAHPAVRRVAAPLLRRALELAPRVDTALKARTAELGLAGFAPQVELVANRSLVFGVREGVKTRVALDGAAAALAQAGDDGLSPNVLLRPVIERAMLPTVAYLAGPGELAYFAQVGAVATALGVPMPLPLMRTSLRIVPPDVRTTLTRHGRTPDEMRDTRALVRELAGGATPDAALDAVTRLRAQIRQSGEAIRAADTGLDAAAIDGALSQFSHRADRLERRVLAASKRRITEQLRRVEQATAVLWPHGGPQERAVNPVPWLARYGAPLMDQMLAACDEGARSLVHGAG